MVAINQLRANPFKIDLVIEARLNATIENWPKNISRQKMVLVLDTIYTTWSIHLTRIQELKEAALFVLFYTRKLYFLIL